MEKIKLFFMQSCTSSRKARKYLEDNEVDYEEIYMTKQSIKWDQFVEILAYTDNGVFDMISKLSAPYKTLSNAGIDFDDLTLTELHEIIVQYPRIVKSLIVIGKGFAMIRYDKDDVTQFNVRENKKTNVY